MLTLGQVAAHLGIPAAEAPPDLELQRLSALAHARPGDLAFIANARYRDVLRTTQASCVLLKEEWCADCPVPYLCVDDPYLAYARISSLFDPEPRPAAGIHASASVDPSAVVPASVAVGAHAFIEAGAVLGEDVVIGPGCFVGRGVRIGESSRLAPNVVLYHGVSLGVRCLVHASTVIGADGFGFARRPDGWEKIAQLGGVRIGDRVDIGAGATIDRGALEDTVIHDDVIIDNQVHIAHNCVIGARTAIAGCVGMAGSTVVGADCAFAGQVGVSGHLKICDNAHFMGQARVAHSIDEPGSYSSGTRLQPTQQWARNAVRFSQLESMQRRIAELEATLKTLIAADESSDTP